MPIYLFFANNFSQNFKYLKFEYALNTANPIALYKKYRQTITSISLYFRELIPFAEPVAEL